MHPFFRPVSTKDSSNEAKQLPETPKSSPNPHQNSPPDQNSTRATNSRPDNTNSTKKQSSKPFATIPKEDYKTAHAPESDLNSERRKRRKTTPFNGSPSSSTADGHAERPDDDAEAGSLSAQRQQAASATKEVEPDIQESVQEQNIFTPGPLSNSPVKLPLRQSPTKTPQRRLMSIDVPLATPPSSQSDTLRGSSVSHTPPAQLTSSTTKKKVLKVTKNGKLVSSPATTSPSSNRKARSGHKEPKGRGRNISEHENALCVTYGKEPDSKLKIGSQIDAILSQSPKPKVQIPSKPPPKITHPFFNGKQPTTKKTRTTVFEDGSTSGFETGADEHHRIVQSKPKDWNDLGFQRKKLTTAKAVGTVETLWPPRDTHNVGTTTSRLSVKHSHSTVCKVRSISKSKQERCSISNKENILSAFAADLTHYDSQLREAFPLPQKVFLNCHAMMDNVRKNLSHSKNSVSRLSTGYPHAFERLQSKVLSGQTSHDNWLLSSAPTQTSEVLQSQSNVLREWLAGQQVHLTAKKAAAVPQPKISKKKRRKRKEVELDDFIVSDEEEDQKSAIIKNAVLITGPNGCGKTASVFAAAKELDFEVFEIYPGMRRSAKDIFEKVGDMAQNHLVQKANKLDQERSSTFDTISKDSSDAAEGNDTIDSFVTNVQQSRRSREQVGEKSGVLQGDLGLKSQARKQSLILFEEVDILFEEDRGFWSGVIQLIELSKRPAVLICNDATSVPVDALPLYAILHYDSIDVEVAVDYLLLLAATEGHSLERDAVHSLYLTKNKDLRASISELNFWCQKSVGSEKCGLDWDWDMHNRRSNTKTSNETLRLYSKDTYTTGMGLVPRTLLSNPSPDRTSLMRFCQKELEIPLSYWNNKLNDDSHGMLQCQPLAKSTVEFLQDSLEIADANSVLDVFDMSRLDEEMDKEEPAGPEPIVNYLSVLHRNIPQPSLTAITSTYLQCRSGDAQLSRSTFFDALAPLMAEKPQFPVSTGRLAPTLDCSSSAVMTDIAPYVRSIVHHDRCLEAFWEGSQGNRARKTRASRAAQEGGSKANTRDEKWFPSGSDYTAMLRTGGQWPIWSSEYRRTLFDGSNDNTKSVTESESTTPNADVEMVDKT